MIKILPNNYNFYWKKYNKIFFMNSLKIVSHEYDSSNDTMHLKQVNGELYIIYDWKDYECRLSEDWFILQKEEIKSITSQSD